MEKSCEKRVAKGVPITHHACLFFSVKSRIKDKFFNQSRVTFFVENRKTIYTTETPTSICSFTVV